VLVARRSWVYEHALTPTKTPRAVPQRGSTRGHPSTARSRSMVNACVARDAGSRQAGQRDGFAPAGLLAGDKDHLSVDREDLVDA
jgi:hypothetical protein